MNDKRIPIPFQCTTKLFPVSIEVKKNPLFFLLVLPFVCTMQVTTSPQAQASASSLRRFALDCSSPSAEASSSSSTSSRALFWDVGVSGGKLASVAGFTERRLVGAAAVS